MKEYFYSIFKNVFRDKYDKDVYKLKEGLLILRKEKVERERELDRVKRELEKVRKEMSLLDSSKLEDETKINDLIKTLKESHQKIEELEIQIKNLKVKNKGLITQIKNLKEGN